MHHLQLLRVLIILVVLNDGERFLTRWVDAQSSVSVGDVDDSVVQLPQRILARLITAQVEAVVDSLIGLSVLRHYAGTYNIHQHTYTHQHT